MSELVGAAGVPIADQPLCRRRTHTSSVRTIRDMVELDRLAPGLDVVSERSASPMQHCIWIRACVAAFGASRELRLVAVGRPEQPVALAPLVQEGGGLGRLHLLGAEELCEPGDLLYADADGLAALAEGLVQTRAPLYLPRVRADSGLVAALRRAYRGRGLVVVRSTSPYPWIPLDASWAQPEQHYNARHRSDFRRFRRRAEELGAVTVEVASPTPMTLAPLLAEAFGVETANWKGRAGTSLARDHRRSAFYRQYAAAAAERGLLRLCFLRIGGRAAAMQMAVTCGGGFWLLKIGYDEEFARCSPGTLLMLETVRHAAEQGLRSYEFLGAVESWTQVWTQHTRACVSVRTYPVAPAGALALASDAARFAGRRLARWMSRASSAEA